MGATVPGDVEIVLVCVECGEQWQGDAGGPAGASDRRDDQVATYPPDCAEADVGDG